MQRNRAYWLLALGAACWLLLVAAVPLLGGHGLEEPAGVIGRAFGRVCHQRPERSFHLADRPLPVCARCLGLYLGIPAGLLLLPLAPRLASRLDSRPRLMVIFVVPMMFDLLLAGDLKLVRLGTGLSASFPVSYFVWRALGEWKESALLGSLR